MHALRRLDHWKQQLLDLSYRNGLLNFKAPKAGGRRSVELDAPPLAAMLASLQAAKRLTLHDESAFPHSKPNVAAAPSKEADGASPDRGALLGEELERRRVYARHEAQELERRLIQLARDARLSRDELGVSTLFLAFGSLVFPDSPGSQVLRRAPLLLVPVELTRKTPSASFQLALSDE